MKKILFVILAALWQQSFADQLLSEAEFVERYIEVTKRQVPGIKAEKKGRLEIYFENSDGEERVSYLDNAYISYKNNPELLNEIIEQYSGSLKQMFQLNEMEFSKAQIFPVIKDRKYVKQVGAMIKEKSGDTAFPFYYEKLNEELYVLYAFDTETSIRFISQEDIDKLGLKNEELRELAKDNLHGSVKLQLQGSPDSVSMLIADGTYEASFILYENMWNKNQFPVKGDIVVYIPSRDLVLITGSEDVEGLKKVRSIVYDPKHEWSHMVSEKGFIRKDNTWEVFK